MEQQDGKKEWIKSRLTNRMIKGYEYLAVLNIIYLNVTFSIRIGIIDVVRFRENHKF